MSLGGLQTKITSTTKIGTTGDGTDELTNGAFLHYHFYSFPFLKLLGIAFSDLCNDDEENLSLDLMFISEFDPT